MLLSFVFCALVANASADVDISGEWVGMIHSEKRDLPVRLTLEQNSGTATLISERIINQPVSKLELLSDVLRITIESKPANLEFSGKVQGRKISGNFQKGEAKSTFELVQLSAVSPENYFGIYQRGPNDFIYIRTWDELGEQQLTFFDDSGRVGPLFAITGRRFFTGPGLWIPLPPQEQIEFVSKDELLWNNKAAKKIAIREEQISFRNHAHQLSGTLVIPEGKGPHKAVVFIHGSGPVTRDFMGPLPYVLARNGFAVLTYDKRGIGKSDGHWLEADFNDLAGDALAAVEFLKTRKEIDAKRIGLLGISQGGWIAPLAASQSHDVTFLILLSTAAVTPAEQQLMTVREEMQLSGAASKEIEQTLKETRAQFDELRAAETKTYLEGEIEKLAAQHKDEFLKSGGLDNPKFLLFYRSIVDFNPRPVLEKIRCPVLAIYGEKDTQVPAADNKDKLVEALGKNGNKNITVRVLLEANHALLQSGSGSMTEFPYLNRFSPEFFPTLIAWLRGL